MTKMLFGIKPKENDYAGAVPYVQYSGKNRLLSPPECAAILAAMSDDKLRPGLVGTTKDSARLDEEYRSVMTRSLPVEGFEWLYERILERVSWVNDANFQFDLSGLAEPIQFLEYREAGEAGESSKAGRYKWHLDMGPGTASIRKLSIVIQLSDPKDYDGCRLRIFDCVTPELEVPEIGQGDMVIFPSWMPHMVSELTRGKRRSLALWVSGPSFK